MSAWLQRFAEKILETLEGVAPKILINNKEKKAGYIIQEWLLCAVYSASLQCESARIAKAG